MFAAASGPTDAESSLVPSLDLASSGAGAESWSLDLSGSASSFESREPPSPEELSWLDEPPLEPQPAMSNPAASHIVARIVHQALRFSRIAQERTHRGERKPRMVHGPGALSERKTAS
jgi:hypothetical protein